MRVLIAGGGTGGHVIPALAVVAELRRRGHNDVLMAGTSRGIETRLAPANNVPLELIDVGALNRVGLWQVVHTVFQLPYACIQASRILERFRPSVVYGVGGYASGPVLLMAAMKGIPIVVHEPNAIPGFANRVIAPFVSRALVAFPEAARYFPATRVEVAGVPVRPQFFEVPAKKREGVLTILITGGSQGAKRINRAVIEGLPLFEKSKYRFTHQTGVYEFAEVEAAFAQSGVEHEVTRFIDDMPAAFARADLLVCRSGASTLAEITAAGKASILVPFPFAADDHQLRNARALEAAGAARVVLNAELNGQRLFDAVQEAAAHLDSMEACSRALGQPHAAEKIADTLEKVAIR